MPIPSQSETWQHPPPDVSLGVGDVHVWRVQLSEWYPQLSQLRCFLSATERARAERYVFEHDQANFTVARGTLRQLLAKYLALRPEEISILTGDRGKPSIANYMNPQDVTFNLSHSYGLCLIAISRGRRLGIDVERIRPDLEPLELAARYFAAEESTALRALPPDRRSAGFFLCWTRKEAYVKARGDGLQIPLDQFSVTLDQESSVALTSNDSELWEIASLSPGHDYAAAIVIERPVHSVSLWNLR